MNNRIIYRESDLVCVGTVTSDMSVEEEINLNVIPNFGGKLEDYSFMETDLKYFELVRENGLVRAVEKEEVEDLGATPEEQRIQELESQIMGLQSAMAELTMMLSTPQ